MYTPKEREAGTPKNTSPSATVGGPSTSAPSSPGDSARGTCVMQTPTSADGKGFWGEYRDRYARLDGRWYFAERIFTMYEFAA